MPARVSPGDVLPQADAEPPPIVTTAWEDDVTRDFGPLDIFDRNMRVHAIDSSNKPVAQLIERKSAICRDVPLAMIITVRRAESIEFVRHLCTERLRRPPYTG